MASTVGAHRGLVVSSGGAIATSQPLATSAGLSILARGGSFADAAIAASAVLCVVEPWASHLGGDAFLIVHDAVTRENFAYNGSGAAPGSATPEGFSGGIPVRGPRSATVPGLVSTWFSLHERHGTIPISELLAAAIGYARDGFPAGPRYVARFSGAAELLTQFPGLSELGADSSVTFGQIVRQPELAATLSAIALGGRDTFYRGEITEKLVEGAGGHFSREDFAAHATRILPPLSVNYRNLTVHGQPPPSQGIILLQQLALLDGFDLASLSDADRIHLGVEAKKLAFADRNAHLADPEFSEPIERLLDPEYIAQRRAQIFPETATDDVVTGLPLSGSDTTYFLVRDSSGSAVSFIQSVFHGFGSAFVAPGTGVLFNNRLTGFSLDPRSPNVLAPGKRPAHTLNAWLATYSDGSLAWVGGTPGGHVQVQTNLQLLINVVDLGLDAQAAIEAPRWQHVGHDESSAVATELSGPGVLEIEFRVDPDVWQELSGRGHDVRAIGEWAHGSAAQLLGVLPSGASQVGSDPRCDGHAAGL